MYAGKIALCLAAIPGVRAARILLMMLLCAAAAGCSVSEHIFNGQTSPERYPTTATLPRAAPANPMTPTQVAATQTELDSLKQTHSQQAAAEIEKSGR